MTPARDASAGRDYRCGYVIIAGRPNVGKSTLLNSILERKLSIISRKPQTTRWRLLGIKTTNRYQAVFVDTPGIQTRFRDALDRHMNREVENALAGVDVLLFVVEAMKWMPADRKVLALLAAVKAPIILVISKIDKVKPREELLAFMGQVAKQGDFAAIVPVSARKGDNIRDLEQSVADLLPIRPAEFPADQLTDRPERFLAAEFIREKLTQKLAKELPYRISVTIERFRRRSGIVHIDAVIWVETESQKAIVIGRQGGILKSVGQQARRDMETLFERRVNLHTWVRVRRRWTNSNAALQRLGYAD